VSYKASLIGWFKNAVICGWNWLLRDINQVSSRAKRGIVIVPADGPPGRDDCDSSPPRLRRSARNDNQGERR